MPLADADDGNVSIRCIVNVVGGQCLGRVPAAGTGQFMADAVVGADHRGQGGEGAILHGDINSGTFAGLRATYQGRHDAAVKMYASEKVDER